METADSSNSSSPEENGSNRPRPRRNRTLFATVVTSKEQVSVGGRTLHVGEWGATHAGFSIYNDSELSQEADMVVAGMATSQRTCEHEALLTVLRGWWAVGDRLVVCNLAPRPPRRQDDEQPQPRRQGNQRQQPQQSADRQLLLLDVVSQSGEVVGQLSCQGRRAVSLRLAAVRRKPRSGRRARPQRRRV
eukprot:TRINITY_DN23479_c0_g1_i1.p1 TRINITY_DN23479_c0_g1~~TRINITY_DN23479_c0_g1_i1.p1  ORF type:complete len:190 (+),score=22.32 TRINITY_DN23479_c0_g1_i1:76-645(+)